MKTFEGGNRRVIFLYNSFSKGGLESVVCTLSEELLKTGFKPTFVFNNLAENHVNIPDGVDLHVIGGYSPLPLTSIKSGLEITKAFCVARNELKRIKRLYPNSVYVACGDMRSAWLALSVGARPLVFWLHISPKSVFASSKKWLLNRFVFLKADKVVVLCKSMADELDELLGNRVRDKTIIIQNPLTIAPLDGLYAPGTHRFVYVGRLDEHQKKISRILKALSKMTCRDWSLVIIGDGPDKEYLQKLAIDLNIGGNIEWAGWQSDPWKYIKENFGGVEALLLTSDYEGYGMVLVEAMANGIPCISTDCPTGPRDIIRNGENGFLISLSSEDAIVEELRKALEVILNGQKTFDSFSMKRSSLDFSSEAVVQKWLYILENT